MEEKRLRIRIGDEHDLAAAKMAAGVSPTVRTEGLPGPGEKTIAPVAAVLVAAGVAALATFVMEFWERLRGGLVIDLREGIPDQMYRDGDVPVGLIIIRAEDGSVEVQAKDTPKSAIHQLIESVIGGVFTSASDIAKAATEAGAKASTVATT